MCSPRDQKYHYVYGAMPRAGFKLVRLISSVLKYHTKRQQMQKNKSILVIQHKSTDFHLSCQNANEGAQVNKA